MPMTLLNYATNERDAYSEARGIAQTALTSGQAELAAAQKRLGDDVTAAKVKETEIQGKRTELANTTVPSEAGRLVNEITQLVIERRQLQQKVLDDQSAVDQAGAALAFAQQSLEGSRVRLAEAEAILSATAAETTRRDSRKAALAQPPLDALTGNAGTAAVLLGSALYTQASDRFGATVVPPKLLESAKLRYELSSQRVAASRRAVDDAMDQLSALAAADGGLNSTAQSKAHAFQRAERRFADYVVNGKQTFERAKAVIEKLADASNPVVTASEAGDALDAAKLVARNAAEAKEKAVVEALAPVDEAQAALDAAILAARADDPNADAATIDGDADVQAARTALSNAQAVLGPLAAAFSPAEKKTLASWQAVLPDRAWQALLDFLEATALLEALKATDPAALQAAMDAAEGEYGDALADVAESRRSNAFLVASIARLRALSEAATGAGPARNFSSLRGDSN
jgi:hypothetical protein